MTPEEAAQEGLESLHIGDTDRAESLFGYALTELQDNADLWHLAGVTAWMMTKHGLAAERFKKAISIDDKKPHFHNNLGNAHQGLKQLNQAIDSYRKALELNPNYAQAWTNLGVAQQHVLRLSEAVESHQKALELEPEHTGALYNLGRAFLELDLPGEAEAVLRQALSHDPADADTLNNLGNAMMKQNKHEDARKLYARALSASPQNVDCICNLGMSYLEEGMLDAAETRLQTALHLDPDHRQSLLHFGYIQNQKNEPMLAEDCYRKLLAEDEKDIEAWIGLGDALNLQGRKNDAVSAYKRALNRNPNLAQAWVQLGNTLFEMGLVEEAKEAHRKGTGVDLTEEDRLISEGIRFEQIGEFDDAIKAYEKAIQLDPGNGTANHMLSVLKGETPMSAPKDYVKNLFDAYSGRFDEHLLDELEYQTPKELCGLLNETMGNESYEKALDLGCGTGLMGVLIRDKVDEMKGVDLSPLMLKEAEKKEIYDDLRQGEIMEELEKSDKYDLIMAADVLVYIGDLKPLMKKVASRLNPGGVFVFSTENTMESEFKLSPRGRFLHSSDHIKQACLAAGLEIQSTQEIPLRKESHLWVNGMGHVVRL